MANHTELQRTDDTATGAELRELFSMDDLDSDDQPLEDIIQVCDGEWRREGCLWRFFLNSDEETPRP